MSFLQRFGRSASSTSAATLLSVSIDALARRRWFSATPAAAATAANAFTTVKHDAPIARRIEAHQEAQRNAKSNVGRPGYNEKGHKILSNDDIAEIKRLRAAEPARWTQRALARRFECSRLQIGIHASSALRQQQHQFVQGVFAQRRVARDPAVRRERLQQYVAKITQLEHASWAAKLAQKEANKLKAAATIEANEAARRAQRAEQDAEKALAEKNRALAKAQQQAAKAHKLGKDASPTKQTKNSAAEIDYDDDDDDIETPVKPVVAKKGSSGAAKKTKGGKK